MTVDLILVGYGNVARAFVTLVRAQRTALRRQHDLDIRIVGIITRRHGHAYSAHGVDANALAQSDARDSSVAILRRMLARSRAAARQRRLVVVETTTLSIDKGEPAIAHVRAALAGGAHVVTANKGPAAFAYGSLMRAAARAKRRFLCEGAVMDGVPIFNLARETLPAVTISGFRGVVNTTTNFILTAMERGKTFDAALKEMQAAGIAESDASLDVEGWDAAAKTAALANAWLGASLTPHAVEREGISADTATRALAARTAGRRLKLVASARREGRRVIARVAPEELPADDLLAGVDGRQNAILLQTDLLDEIAVVQRGGSLTQTAYALLADLFTVARDVNAGPARRRSPRSERPGQSP